MHEFELRFRINSKKQIVEKLQTLGFAKSDETDMTDIIFEPCDWDVGKPICEGFFIVRLRLQNGKQPKLELKEFVSQHKWREETTTIDNAMAAIEILSKVLAPKRVISKKRESWHSDACDVVIAVDEVKSLGSFIEIEGEEEDVRKIAAKFGFANNEALPPYGSMIFALEREGKIKFSIEDMHKAVEFWKNKTL